jgi:hypothetical protein
MEALKALVALAAGPGGAAEGFADRHVAALRRVLADVELAAVGEKGLDAYRRLLVAADPIMAPRHVKARWAAIEGLPREELRDGMLALAAELKREDLLGEAWQAALNDYTVLMKIRTGDYQPIEPAELRIGKLAAIVGTGAKATARVDDFVAKLMGLLEIAEYEGLEWSPETAQNLRDDLRYLLARREELAAAPAAVRAGRAAAPRRAVAAAR